jgi:hypothetical protein
MTEKDFRKIVTDLELTKNDKENISEFIKELTNKLNENLKNFKIIEVRKALSLADGTMYHGSKNLDLMLVVDNPVINSYPLMNQAILHEVWNFFVFEYKLDKINQIQIDYNLNSIKVNLDQYNLNLLIRFNEVLNYQTNFYISTDELKTTFINIAASEFNLFKNTIQLITYYRDINNLDSISTYVIESLLYYGLSENFTKHTYELYLKEFIHAIDDLSKGVKIDQDNETYRKLNIERINLPKKQYMVIDVTDPKTNLVSGIGEAYLSDLRKLKKIILKLLEIKAE